MTSRERLFAALKRQPVDRIPIAVHGIFPYDPLFVQHVHPSYRPLINYVEKNCDSLELWSPDFGFFLSDSMNGNYREEFSVDANGNTNKKMIFSTPKGELSAVLTQPPDQPALITKFWIDDEADLNKFLSIPYRPLVPDMHSFHQRSDGIGDKGVVVVHLQNATGYSSDKRT